MKSMGDRLSDRRSTHRSNLRRQQIQSRIKSLRQQTIYQQDHSQLFLNLPTTIPTIYQLLLNHNPPALKTCIANHLHDLHPHILTTTFEQFRALCFILTDVMVSVELSLAKEVANKTITPILTKSLQYFTEMTTLRMSLEMAVFRYAVIVAEVLGVQNIPDREFNVLCELVRDRIQVFDQTSDEIEAIYQPLSFVNFVLEQHLTKEPSTRNDRINTCVEVCFGKGQGNVKKIMKLAMDSAGLANTLQQQSSPQASNHLSISLLQLLVNLTHKLSSPQCLLNHSLLYCLLNTHLNSPSSTLQNLAVKLFHNTLTFQNPPCRQAHNFGIIHLFLRMLTTQVLCFEHTCDVVDSLSRYVLAVEVDELEVLEAFVSADGVETLLYVVKEKEVYEFQVSTLELVLFAVRKIVVTVVEKSKVLRVFGGFLEGLRDDEREGGEVVREVCAEILELVEEEEEGGRQW